MPARQPGRRPKSSPVWAYAADLDENGMPPLGQKPNNKDFRVFRCKACIEKGPKKAYEYAIQGGIAHFRAHLLKHHNIVVPMTIESSATELATELTQETRERTSTMSHEIPPRESSLRQGGTQEAPLRNGNRGEKRERDEGDIEDELAIVESKVRVEEIKKRLAELEVSGYPAGAMAINTPCHKTNMCFVLLLSSGTEARTAQRAAPTERSQAGQKEEKGR